MLKTFIWRDIKNETPNDDEDVLILTKQNEVLFTNYWKAYNEFWDVDSRTVEAVYWTRMKDLAPE